MVRQVIISYSVRDEKEAELVKTYFTNIFKHTTHFKIVEWINTEYIPPEKIALSLDNPEDGNH